MIIINNMYEVHFGEDYVYIKLSKDGETVAIKNSVFVNIALTMRSLEKRKDEQNERV